jgi:hypothetical protein
MVSAPTLFAIQLDANREKVDSIAVLLVEHHLLHARDIQLSHHRSCNQQRLDNQLHNLPNIFLLSSCENTPFFFFIPFIRT